MIVKRLRLKNNWSQEQLAQFSGLSLRTIQRIESGQKPSIESVKALAAVFDISITTLQQNYMLIDKNSKQWQQHPKWLKVIFWGSNYIWLRSRQEAVWFECFIALMAIVFLVAAFIQPASDRIALLSLSLVCTLSAYIWSVLIRLSDKYHIWQTGH